MTQTAAAVQAVLGTNPNNAQILQSRELVTTTSLAVLNSTNSIGIEDGTSQYWYVQGNGDAPGRARWCTTTASDSAATQAASILTSLRA